MNAKAAWIQMEIAEIKRERENPVDWQKKSVVGGGSGTTCTYVDT